MDTVILQKRFAARVHERLEELGWNKAQLSREMKVDRSYLSPYLNGHRSPGLDVIERFAIALQCDPVDLLCEPKGSLLSSGISA